MNITSEEPYYIQNMILLLTLTPGGLTKDEVKQLCKDHKAWFYDYEASDERPFDYFQNLYEVN